MSEEEVQEMSKEIMDLLHRWQSRGLNPAMCAYAMIMKFTAIAHEIIGEDDLMFFLEDARTHGLQVSDLMSLERPEYVN